MRSAAELRGFCMISAVGVECGSTTAMSMVLERRTALWGIPTV
jgi:hypothetical protein